MSAGALTVVSLAKETTWGTAVTPSKSIAIKPSGGFNIKENIQMISALKGVLAKNHDSYKGKISYEASYTFDSWADYLGYFLLSAFGTVNSAAKIAPNTSVFDHTFTESATKIPLTIEESISENCRRYAGSIVSSVKISGKSGETVQVETSVMAKTQASATAITPATTIVPCFNHAQVVFKVGGSSIAEAQAFEIEYKNNLEMVYALGNAEPSYYAPKPSEVSGKATFYLDSTTITQLTNYINKTRQAVELVCTGITIGTSANYGLDVLIPQADLTTADTKITDGFNALEIAFEGVYDTGTSKLVSVVLTNLITAY